VLTVCDEITVHLKQKGFIFVIKLLIVVKVGVSLMSLHVYRRTCKSINLAGHFSFSDS
jgi:hypothetical protein